MENTEEQRMKPGAAAKYIGCNPTTLWNMANRGEIGFIKLGRTRLYEKSELDRWLSANRVEAKS